MGAVTELRIDFFPLKEIHALCAWKQHTRMVGQEVAERVFLVCFADGCGANVAICVLVFFLCACVFSFSFFNFGCVIERS